jgi:hypothetical protein
MSRTIRLSLLAVATTALVACGGGAKLGGGKEGAAKALFEASQPAGKGGNSSSQGLLLNGKVDPRLLASAANTSLEVAVDCSHGGSVKLKLDLTSLGNQNGSFKYDLEYKDCNEDGANKFKGKMTMEFSLAGTATSIELALRLKGKIEISGDIDDFLDADVTETISATATSATSGSVTVKLNGTIKTSEGLYVYNNETLTISADGALPMADGNS